MDREAISIVLPAAGPRMTIAVEMIPERDPGRLRLWLSAWLIRLAGRLVRMRVRIEPTR